MLSYPFADSKQLEVLQKEFYTTLDSFSEFKSIRKCKKEGFVMGGFSALGNASSKLHWTNLRDKLEKFSLNIIDECKEKEKCYLAKIKIKYIIVRRFLPSLSEYKDNIIYYKKRELTMYTPNNKWFLSKPFRKRLKQHFSFE